MQSSTDTELMVNLCGGFVWRGESATLEQGFLSSSRAAVTRVCESLPRDVNAECACVSSVQRSGLKKKKKTLLSGLMTNWSSQGLFILFVLCGCLLNSRAQ